MIEYCLIAEMMPVEMPTMIEKIIAVPTSRSVFGQPRHDDVGDRFA